MTHSGYLRGLSRAVEVTGGEVEPQVCLLKTKTQVSLVGLGLRPRAIGHQQVLECKKMGKACFRWHRLGRVGRSAMLV